MYKPRATNQPTNQPHLKFSVIVLTWAGLMDRPATVLDLPGVAIPGEVLATQAVSVQSLPLTVLLRPGGGPEAPGRVQEGRVRSHGGHVAVDVRPHSVLSVPSGAARAVQLLGPTAGLTERRAGVVHGVHGHAGVLDEQVLQRAGLHLDGGQPSGGEAGRRGDEPALLQGAGLKLEEAGVAWVGQAFERRR